MSNYKEDTVKGWQRVKSITIDNALGVIPTIVFAEEMVITSGDAVFHHDVQGMQERFSDPSIVFPLLNPEDGTVIGEATYGQVYATLYSLYIALAAKRDAVTVG